MKTTKAFTNTALAGLAALSLGLTFSSVAEAKPVLVQRGSHGAYFLVSPKKAATKSQAPKVTKQEEPQGQVNKTKDQTQSNESRSRKIITRGPNGAAFIVYN